jgi:choline monooxygenase
MERPAARIFDDHEIEAIKRPIEDAAPPPAAYYTSHELYEREVDRIFFREWQWAGNAAQLAEPGSYFALTIASEPVVVVRGRDGVLRAFSAVCRHRGAIIATGLGKCAAFTCPYHGWTYSLTGELVAAPEMDQARGFDRRRYGLVPLAVETWEGIVFVNFDPHPRPLAETLGDLPDFIRNYRLGDMVCAARRTYDFACNWKMLVENAMEGYHVPITHQCAAGTEYMDIRCWGFKKGGTGLWDDLLFQGSRALTLNKPGSVGDPAWTIEGLTDEQRLTHHFILIYPTLMMILQPDAAVFYVMLPDGGPDRCKLVCEWRFPEAVASRPDFAELTQNAVASIDGFNDEDIAICNLTFQGCRSRLFRPGRYSHYEQLPHRFAHYIMQRALDEEVPAR